MKVSIVGIGRVGAAAAHAVVLREIAEELVLVNRTPDVALGEAADLRHAAAFMPHPMEIRGGPIEETKDSDAVVMCLSAPMPRELKSRLALGSVNAPILDAWMPKLAALSPDAVFILVTNPVDVMTHRALQLTGLPDRQVVGSGTLIDSARFRALLSAEVGIHTDDIRAYVLGEHGDSQLPALSFALAGGERVDAEVGKRAFERTLRSGYDVMKLKGHTSYGVGQAVATVLDAVCRDAHRTMPLSVRVDGYEGIDDVCLSIPVVIGRRGVLRKLHPELDAAESEALRASAKVVREAIAALPEVPKLERIS